MFETFDNLTITSSVFNQAVDIRMSRKFVYRKYGISSEFDIINLGIPQMPRFKIIELPTLCI
jgi:hypothetical protein